MSAQMNDADYKTLDAAAFPASAEALDEERVYAAIDAIAARGEAGLRGLIKRYASSQVPAVVRGLSFAFAKAADSVTTRTCNLVYELWDALSVKDDDSTLTNCLTAIQRQAIAGLPWRPQERAPKALYSLVEHCLDRGELVQSSVLDMLTRLYEDGRFDTAFSPTEREAVVQKISSLMTTTDSNLLRLSLDGLRDLLPR